MMTDEGSARGDGETALGERETGMMKHAVILAACLALAACGGGNRVDRGPSSAQVRVASGPIADACLRAGRKDATRRLCGCVQNVADRDLTGADQRLAVGFFANPHRAQEIRQSPNPRHEAFWQRYKAFVARAESVCRGV
jgi:hypothetical protein